MPPKPPSPELSLLLSFTHRGFLSSDNACALCPWLYIQRSDSTKPGTEDGILWKQGPCLSPPLCPQQLGHLLAYSRHPIHIR